MKNKTFQDARIKVKMFSWKNFVVTFLMLMLFSLGQTAILSIFYYDKGGALSMNLVIGMQIYWAILALLFCVLARHYIIDTYDEPIYRIGDAARRVAQGDFSIYIPPDHPASEATSLDVMIEDFNKMVASLGSGEVLKSDFVANVSHEIRTPVAIIENSTVMLGREGISKEEQQKYIADIHKSTNVLVSLTRKLLVLNQLENHTFDVETQQYGLHEQLCECILNYEDALDEKQINLDLDVDEKLTISGNPDLLDIVWDSLLSNAIKFTAAGGEISLHASTDEDGVMVSISDNGCGMSEDTLNHAFEKFWQGDVSHSQEGNGLGLSLARAAAQLAHATISVRSRLGLGSEFMVHLAQ